MKSVDTSMISRYFEFSIAHQTVPVPGEKKRAEVMNRALFGDPPTALDMATWQQGLVGLSKTGLHDGVPIMQQYAT